MSWRKRKDEVEELRAELERVRAAEAKRRAVQRHADETGWDLVTGRWSKPGRAARDRLARGGDS